MREMILFPLHKQPKRKGPSALYTEKKEEEFPSPFPIQKIVYEYR
jgi:hypothetical protein